MNCEIRACAILIISVVFVSFGITEAFADIETEYRKFILSGDPPHPIPQSISETHFKIIHTDDEFVVTLLKIQSRELITDLVTQSVHWAMIS